MRKDLVLPSTMRGACRRAVGTVVVLLALGGGGGAAALAAASVETLVYLNRDGVTVGPGPDDARTNLSSVATQRVQLLPWTTSAALWAETVACLRDMFATYHIAFVERDPGNVPHLEAVFTDSSASALSPGWQDAMYGGLAPATWACASVPNAMVYTFTQQVPATGQRVCEVMAQELGHAFGLDHAYLAADPMAYLPYAAPRVFQNVDTPCGEWAPRACGAQGECGATQNSVAMLTARLGAAPPAQPWQITGVQPATGSRVAPTFAVVVETDLENGELTVVLDAVPVARRAMRPWIVQLTNLAPGAHTLVIELVGAGAVQQRTLAVEVVAGAGVVEGGQGPSATWTGERATSGCATGAHGGLGSLGCVAGAWLWLARRRRFTEVTIRNYKDNR